MRYLFLILSIGFILACANDTTSGTKAAIPGEAEKNSAPAPETSNTATQKSLNGWSPVSQYLRLQYYRGTATSNADVRTAIYKFTVPGRGIRQVFWQADGNETCAMKQAFKWQLDELDGAANTYTLLIEPAVVQQVGSACPSDQPMPTSMSAGFNEPFRVTATLVNEQLQIEGWSL